VALPLFFIPGTDQYAISVDGTGVVDHLNGPRTENSANFDSAPIQVFKDKNYELKILT
jgi:hypothetical protein